MIDTSGIDIKAVIDQLCSIRWQKASTVKGARQIKGGPCPLCGVGTDRFIIWPYGNASNPTPRFYCGIHGNGCKAHGDVIDFVRLLKGYLSAYQAICDLQEMGYMVGGDTQPRTYTQQREQAPSQKWQDSGNALIHAAEKYLWSPVGKDALDYLHKRGLTDETLKHFRIGYWPKWTECQRKAWGLPEREGETPFKIPRGIIIPVFEGNTLWKIVIRRPPKDIARAKGKGRDLSRYTQVEGGGNGLFNIDAIVPGQNIFMTEGPFDAIVGQQETGYPFVATCGTKGAMMARWVARLSLASHILLAFDNDEGKGEAAAAEWLNIFKDKATLWLPTVEKDITDMWLQGQDIKLWGETAIKLVSNVAAEETPIPEPTEQEPVHAICCMCLDAGEEVHAPFIGPDDFMYCQRHYKALPSEWHKAEMERIAEAYRRILPGWNVHIEPRATWEQQKADLLQKAQEAIRCHAVWHLNKDGKPCKAGEPVAKVEECGCSVWGQSSQGEYFCAKCYTPLREEVQPEDLHLWNLSAFTEI